MLLQIIYVAIGGAIGSIFRYLLSNPINITFKETFPLGTFIVNLLGCFLIGILVGLFEKQVLSNPLYKLLFITGFCGGFTTFSTYAYESIQLFNLQQFFTLFFYVFLSNVAGFLLAMLGLYLTK